MVCIEGSTVAVGTVIAYWVDFGFTFIGKNDITSNLATVTWRFPIA